MRATLTFVLRLLVDTGDPQALRGILRTVGSAEDRTFADGQALLALLRQIADVKSKTANRQNQVIGIEPSITSREEQT
jgi:hypothetical protein